MKTNSVKSRIMGTVIAASIAWQPIYGQRFSLPSGVEKLPSAPSGVPAINLKPGLSGGLGSLTGNTSQLPGVKLQGSKSCNSPDFSKFKDLIKVELDKDAKNSVKAPIFNDIGPCDLELYAQCTQTLMTALNNPAQALVGLDDARDSEVELGSKPQYAEQDVRAIRSVLGQLNDVKESVKPGYDPTKSYRALSNEERQLDTILDIRIPAQNGVLSAEDIATITSIHLGLSSQLVAMSEAADAEPSFVSLVNPRALLQEINPVADSALACLLGFKKPNADQPIRTGKRKVIGYASGFVYGEVGAESQGLVITLVGAECVSYSDTVLKKV